MIRTHAIISAADQSLELREGVVTRKRYRISTSKYGLGEETGSFKTPRGHHYIRAKIGAGCPEGTVFVGRRPTGEVYSAALAARYPDRDWILTRILWLSGLERGHNRLGSVDTMRRFIYIHGTPDSEPLGEAGSIGCIRMSNREVIEFFDRVPVGLPVEIR
jgi:L,D-transpeptidase YbiS